MRGAFKLSRRQKDDEAVQKTKAQQHFSSVSNERPSYFRAIARLRCQSVIEGDDGAFPMAGDKQGEPPNSELLRYKLVSSDTRETPLKDASSPVTQRFWNASLDDEEATEVRILGSARSCPDVDDQSSSTSCAIGSAKDGDSSLAQIHGNDSNASTSDLASYSEFSSSTNGTAVPTAVTVSTRSPRTAAGSSPSTSPLRPEKVSPRLPKLEKPGPDTAPERPITTCKFVPETCSSTMKTSTLNSKSPPTVPMRNLSLVDQAQEQEHAPSVPWNEENERLVRECEASERSSTYSSLPHSLREYSFVIKEAGRIEWGVMTVSLQHALSGLLLSSGAGNDFKLKFSLQRDGASLSSLLEKVERSSHTILAVETKTGHVFGAFCSTKWCVQPSWFGSESSFLWCLKNSRLASGSSPFSYVRQDELTVYPFTGHDTMVQFCTNTAFGVGGGKWESGIDCPCADEPVGIGLVIDGDLLGGETNACATFANPRLCRWPSKHNEFEIRALEVWSVKPCDS